MKKDIMDKVENAICTLTRTLSVFGIAYLVLYIRTLINEVGYIQTLSTLLFPIALFFGLVVFAAFTHYEEQGFYGAFKGVTLFFFCLAGIAPYTFMFFDNPYNPDYISALPISIAIIGIVSLCRVITEYIITFRKQRKFKPENTEKNKETPSKIKKVVMEFCHVFSSLLGQIVQLIGLAGYVLCALGIVFFVYCIHAFGMTGQEVFSLVLYGLGIFLFFSYCKVYCL